MTRLNRIQLYLTLSLLPKKKEEKNKKKGFAD